MFYRYICNQSNQQNFLIVFFQVFVYSMFVSQMAFNAKISDPLIGGTYMTLLNTVANLGKRTYGPRREKT